MTSPCEVCGRQVGDENEIMTGDSIVVGRRCMWCSHWQPLGAANDDSPEVAIEIRAAELVDQKSGSPVSSRMNLMESIDWDDWEGDDEEPPVSKYALRDTQRLNRWWRSGWLARAIVNEEQDQ